MRLSFNLSALVLGALVLPACESISSIGNDKTAATDASQVSTTRSVQRTRTELDYPTYDKRTLVDEAESAFGEASAEIAEVIDNVFASQGRPQAYIAGEEASGAIGVGLAYGNGQLFRPGQEPIDVFWQGPSIGFDLGGDASKVFILIYKLGDTENIYRRFPGGGANIFFVGGVGAEAMTANGVTIVPIRTGIGARSGVAVEYMKITRQRTINPF